MTVDRSFEEELRDRLVDLAEPVPTTSNAVVPAIRSRVARQRRRANVLAVAAVALVAVSGVAGWLIHPPGVGHRPAVTAQGPAQASQRPSAAVPPICSRLCPDRSPLGTVIPAGKASNTEERVFYAVAVNDPALPGVHFGVMAGRRGPSGEVIGDVLANELRGGSDRSPGFHAVTDAQRVGDRPVPMFGYFVGPAAQIVTRTGTGRVTAHLAAWSEDHRVLIFWFDLADVPPYSSVDGISALDGSGRRIPT
jgi:hypothetical protein